jgi:hypothetical protein
MIVIFLAGVPCATALSETTNTSISFRQKMWISFDTFVAIGFIADVTVFVGN